MDIKKYLFPSSTEANDGVFSKIIDPKEKFIKIRGWLSSLSNSDRTNFINQFLMPVFGEDAALWVKQQLVAERNELQVDIDNHLAKVRMEYSAKIQPLLLQHIKTSFQEIDRQSSSVSFNNPVLQRLWDVAVARTGMDIVASGQTTYDEMLSDFDKILAIFSRMIDDATKK
jgi:hypothetical protein